MSVQTVSVPATRPTTTEGDLTQEYLTVPEVQRLLRVGRSVVYQSIANGTIKSVRIGRLIRIPRSAISA
jgi:excisionase family DNA binding protein